MINRNNYEEFLLMYVDNELNAQERAAVDLFLQQNPDLLPELETLQQTVLSANDEILLEDKSGLFRINSSISIENYEEYFLLDIDGELDAKAKNEVEKFVLQHPQLQSEFTLLLQTVLEPEQVIFADKQSLYRKEKRVIPFAWMRVAAAAAVIGFAILVWWLIPSGKNTIELAGTKPAKENTVPAANNTVKEIQPQTVKPEQQNGNEVAVATPVQNKKYNSIAVKENKTKRAVIKSNIPVTENIALNKTQTNQQKSSLPEEVLPEEKEKTIAYQQPVIDNQQPVLSDYASIKNTDVAANLIKLAVYKELNTDDDNNESLYVGNLNLNKNKLRGVIKKVGGLFAGKAKNAIASNDQGKLQVANLEFNKN